MRRLWLSLFLTSATTFCLTAQKKYSFGTDYGYYMLYPEEDRKSAVDVFQYGLAATRQFSLRSHLIVGAYYYLTDYKSDDLVDHDNKYLEVPLSIKTNFSIFDGIFVGHMTNGIGGNIRLAEKNKSYLKSGQEIVKEGGLKMNAANFFSGFGFDVRVNKYFYFSIDGVIKGLYFFDEAIRHREGKISISPMWKTGIFVWLN